VIVLLVHPPGAVLPVPLLPMVEVPLLAIHNRTAVPVVHLLPLPLLAIVTHTPLQPLISTPSTEVELVSQPTVLLLPLLPSFVPKMILLPVRNCVRTFLIAMIKTPVQSTFAIKDSMELVLTNAVTKMCHALVLGPFASPPLVISP
jgi:hypothetical protein